MRLIHVKHPAQESAPRAYGPRTAPGEQRRCRIEGCGRPLPPGARAHVCRRCAVQASRGRACVGPCQVCGCSDVRVLGLVQLADGEVVLCANDKAIAGRLGLTLAELRVEAGTTQAA